MQVLLGQGRPGFASDGILCEVFLQLVIGVVRHVANAAAVNNGSFFFLGQEMVKFRIIAGGNDQGINRPFIPVDFDTAVLDNPQVDLHQIFFVFKNFVTEVDSAAGYPGQCTSS